MKTLAPKFPAFVLLACLATAGCGETPPETDSERDPERSWAEGTVLAVDAEAITGREVDEVAATVGDLYPEYTLVHTRRLAATNVAIPRAAARSQAGESRERARQECDAALADVARAAEASFEVSGNWNDLGLALWHEARRLEPDVWSSPIELPGRFVLARLLELRHADDPWQEFLRLQLLDYPYVGLEAEREALDAAIDASVLEIVDPAYDEVVPEQWKYRMRGEKP